MSHSNHVFKTVRGLVINGHLFGQNIGYQIYTSHPTNRFQIYEAYDIIFWFYYVKNIHHTK